MIIKSKHAGNYTVLPNEVFKQNLSLEAIGLLAQLLSFPHNWKIVKTKLHLQLNTGRDKVGKVFNELKEKGFIITEKQHNTNGRLIYDHIVYDTPQQRFKEKSKGKKITDSPHTEKPLTVKPLTVNQSPLLKKQELKKQELKKQKKDIYVPDFSEFLEYAKTLKPYKVELDFAIEAKYESWKSDGWKNGFGKPIKNWKVTLQNTITHLKKTFVNDVEKSKYPTL